MNKNKQKVSNKLYPNETYPGYNPVGVILW